MINRLLKGNNIDIVFYWVKKPKWANTIQNNPNEPNHSHQKRAKQIAKRLKTSQIMAKQPKFLGSHLAW